MNQTATTARAIGLAVAIALTTAASPAVADGLDFAKLPVPTVLVGTWKVVTTPYDCVTGEVYSDFARPSMLTFGLGGTIAESAANPGFQPGQRSSGHGYWERTGRRAFNAVFEAYILFTSVVTPPTPPQYVQGTQRFDHGIEMADADHWTSYVSVTFLDTAGTPSRPPGCAQSTAERMQ